MVHATVIQFKVALSQALNRKAAQVIIGTGRELAAHSVWSGYYVIGPDGIEHRRVTQKMVAVYL